MAKKVAPVKRGDINFTHNLYDVLGKTLLDGVRSGRLDPKKVSDSLTANIGLDLGGGYGADLGYNQYIGDRKQDLKLTIKKRF